MALCQSIAHVTERIPFGTSIANLYTRHVSEWAQHAAFVHEISGGRFRFGVGVSHRPMNDRLGIATGKPLGEMRSFVEQVRGAKRIGDLPPLVLAGLRKKMVALAGEVGDGVVFANVARSHVPETLTALPEGKQHDDTFFIGDMIPTCISDDREAAAAVNRRTLTMYLHLPNYRNYWKEAGYEDEMTAIEAAIAAGESEKLPGLMTDRWLADCTLLGSVAEVRDGLEAWFDAGVTTPILVPSSAAGGQKKAFEELFAAFE